MTSPTQINDKVITFFDHITPAIKSSSSAMSIVLEQSTKDARDQVIKTLESLDDDASSVEVYNSIQDNLYLLTENPRRKQSLHPISLIPGFDSGWKAGAVKGYDITKPEDVERLEEDFPFFSYIFQHYSAYREECVEEYLDAHKALNNNPIHIKMVDVVATHLEEYYSTNIALLSYKLRGLGEVLGFDIEEVDGFRPLSELVKELEEDA